MYMVGRVQCDDTPSAGEDVIGDSLPGATSMLIFMAACGVLPG